MIDLYTFGTGNCWRASIILEECELAYRVHKIDIAKGAQHTDDFRKLNPLGKIPVIVDSDGPGGVPITLSQSGAILIYCAEKAGRFIPADTARRAQAMQWMILAVSDGSDIVGGILRLLRMPDSPAAAVSLYKARLSTLLQDVDTHLAAREFLADELSIADLALYPIAASGADLVGIRHLPHLQRWFSALSVRPALRRGMAVPGENV